MLVLPALHLYHCIFGHQSVYNIVWFLCLNNLSVHQLHFGKSSSKKPSFKSNQVCLLRCKPNKKNVVDMVTKVTYPTMARCQVNKFKTNPSPLVISCPLLSPLPLPSSSVLAPFFFLPLLSSLAFAYSPIPPLSLPIHLLLPSTSSTTTTFTLSLPFLPLFTFFIYPSLLTSFLFIYFLYYPSFSPPSSTSHGQEMYSAA